MLRQNSLQTRTLAGAKPDVEKLEEASEIESLRAAYMSVAGNSGRVISGKVMQESLHSLSNTVSVHAETPRLENSPTAPPKNTARYSVSKTEKSNTFNPVDVALQTIAQANDISEPKHVAQKPSIEQALLRGQEFSRQTIISSPVSRPVETAPTAVHNAISNTVQVAPTAPVAAPKKVSAPEIIAKTPTQQAVQATIYAPQQVAESQSARPVKLPKFLVAPDGENTTTAAKPNGNPSFGVSGNTKSSSIPLNLFGDLKPSTVKSVDTLIQEEDARQAASALKSETKPAREFFNTTDSGPKANGSASFLDYLNVPADTAVKTAGAVSVEGETEWMDRYQRYESVWVKLFERPRLLLGMLGLGIVSCSVYIALGYWWFGGSPISQAAETVNLLNVQEDINAGTQDPTTTFNNIRSIQKDAGWTKPKNSEQKPGRGKHENMLLAEAAPAGGLMGEPSSAAAATGSGLEPVKTEPTGRPDPFDPLVSANGNSTNGSGKEEETKKRDILLDLQYTGFIGDINSRDKVAIIRVSDTVTGVNKTQIKKVGESFPVDGEVVVLRGISKKALLLSAQGETRQLPLQQYVAVKPVAQADSGASQGGAATGGAPSSGTYAPGSLPGAGGSSFSPPAGKGGNPASVSLSEPKN